MGLFFLPFFVTPAEGRFFSRTLYTLAHSLNCMLQEYRVFGSMRVGITSVPDEEEMREEAEQEEIIAKV